jgi:hypothetical protein
MRLTLQRQKTNAHAVTHGEMVTADLPLARWLTLEDAVREIPGQPVSQWKVPRETAIPAGVYPVTLTVSNRFKVVLPLIGNVPGFEGVRIHAGNVIEDTEGCVLVGRTRFPKSIGESRLALQALLLRLTTTPGPHSIEVRNA